MPQRGGKKTTPEHKMSPNRRPGALTVFLVEKTELGFRSDPFMHNAAGSVPSDSWEMRRSTKPSTCWSSSPPRQPGSVFQRTAVAPCACLRAAAGPVSVPAGCSCPGGSARSSSSPDPSFCCRSRLRKSRRSETPCLGRFTLRTAPL